MFKRTGVVVGSGLLLLVATFFVARMLQPLRSLSGLYVMRVDAAVCSPQSRVVNKVYSSTVKPSAVAMPRGTSSADGDLAQKVGIE